MNEKNIYIVLTRTTTVISRLIAFLTDDTYTHASIALDKELSKMYSFGRKKRYNPLIGGFCQENMDKGVFADCRALPYAIVKLNVTEDQYEKASLLINSYIQNSERYRYNFTGLLFAWRGKSYKSSHRFYCSEFVYDLLNQSEIILKKPPTVIRPQEFICHGQVIEEGDWTLNRKEIKASRLSKLHFLLKPIADII